MSNNITTEIAILKKEVADMKIIFNKLDTAIERITDVSSSVNRMLAVHEEKIANQEEAATRANLEFTTDIRELHSRITTNYKELTDIMSEHSKQDAINQQTLRDDLNNRVGILEKWRWLIIGGSIVLGFIIQKMPIWG
jgi:phage host-nuclease inhibitor protein Gam|tara:strand:+ start:64 stop:477 length:414 start_codon:yes stop_codon:yes gene_type:complete